MPTPATVIDGLSMSPPVKAGDPPITPEISFGDIQHSAITDLPPFGIAVLPFKDPDGVALELTAPL